MIKPFQWQVYHHLMLQIKFTLPHWQPENWHDHIGAAWGTLLSTRNTRTSGMYWKFVSIRLIRITGLMSSWAQYVEHHPPSPSVRQSIFTWKLQKFISNLIISVLSEPSTPLAPADSDIILERCASFFSPWPCYLQLNYVGRVKPSKPCMAFMFSPLASRLEFDTIFHGSMTR